MCETTKFALNFIINVLSLTVYVCLQVLIAGRPVVLSPVVLSHGLVAIFIMLTKCKTKGLLTADFSFYHWLQIM